MRLVLFGPIDSPVERRRPQATRLASDLKLELRCATVSSGQVSKLEFKLVRRGKRKRKLRLKLKLKLGLIRSTGELATSRRRHSNSYNSSQCRDRRIDRLASTGSSSGKRRRCIKEMQPERLFVVAKVESVRVELS